MTEPRRLLADPAATHFERNLLESWSSETPSPDAQARALAIAGVVAASAIGGAAAAAAPKAAAIALSGAAKLGLAGAMLLASAIVSLVIVTGSGGVPAPVHRKGPAPAAVDLREPGSGVATSRPADSSTAREVEPPSVSPADLQTVPPVAAPAAPRAQGSVAAPTGSLSEEIESFERARASLERGDVDRAIGLIDAYEKRYPAGVFAQEAEVLRVKALTAKGDVAGARRAGERFLSANPASPHAPRVRAILDSSHP